MLTQTLAVTLTTLIKKTSTFLQNLLKAELIELLLICTAIVNQQLQLIGLLLQDTKVTS